MDNLNMTMGMGLADSTNVSINAEQNGSLMRYLEQAAVHSQSEMTTENEIKDVQRSNDVTAQIPVKKKYQPKRSILQQMPNIQSAVVSLEDNHSAEAKSRKNVHANIKLPDLSSLAKFKKKEAEVAKKKEDKGYLDARKFAEKVSNKKIDVIEWIIMYLITFIPIVNYIVLIKWSLGKTDKPDKINWARAYLIITTVMYLLIGISAYFTLWDIIKLYLPF